MDFTASVESLGDMLSFIKEKASSAGLDRGTTRKIELASEEAIVNIISYAYQGAKEGGKIIISTEYRGKKRFEITLRDQGIPFNPLEMDMDAEVKKPLQDRKVGGLGIYLIEQLMDEVSYEREENQNVLRMVINFP